MTNETYTIKPPTLRPRRWFGLLFWTAAIVFFSWLWSRSYVTTDLGAVYTRSGNINGALSHRGNLLVGISTLSLGPDKALTAEHIAAPVEDGDWLYDGAYTNASTKKNQWDFGYAISKPGDLPVKDATWSAVSFPHWAAITFCSLILLWHLWRFTLRTRERRWRKKGRCVACGYDLQGNPSDRCPECGTPTMAAGAAATTSLTADAAATAKQAANVVATLLLIFATAWAARLYAKPPGDAETLAAEEEAAGLNRQVKDVEFEGANWRQVMDTIREKAGIAGDVEPVLRQSQVRYLQRVGEAPRDPFKLGSIHGEFRDASVRTIVGIGDDQTPIGMATLAGEDATSRAQPVVRAHDTKGLKFFSFGLPFPADQLAELLVRFYVIGDPRTGSTQYHRLGDRAIVVSRPIDQVEVSRFIAGLQRAQLP